MLISNLTDAADSSIVVVTGKRFIDRSGVCARVCVCACARESLRLEYLSHCRYSTVMVPWKQCINRFRVSMRECVWSAALEYCLHAAESQHRLAIVHDLLNDFACVLGSWSVLNLIHAADSPLKLWLARYCLIDFADVPICVLKFFFLNCLHHVDGLLWHCLRNWFMDLFHVSVLTSVQLSVLKWIGAVFIYINRLRTS